MKLFWQKLQHTVTQSNIQQTENYSVYLSLKLLSYIYNTDIKTKISVQ